MTGTTMAFAAAEDLRGATATEAGTEVSAQNSVVTLRLVEDRSVTRTEVSISAETVGVIGSKTDADLLIITPVANAVILNDGLGTLASAGHRQRHEDRQEVPCRQRRVCA